MTERSVKKVAAGLYDPAFEHDSCGFGLIAQLVAQRKQLLTWTAID